MMKRVMPEGYQSPELTLLHVPPVDVARQLENSKVHRFSELQNYLD